jgi:signal recognition particle receptor subunit beta
VQVDFRAREVALKLVYYGPALSGKTSNLRALHTRIAERQRTHLVTLDTRDDRTLFFDLLPLSIRTGAVSLRIKLYTVPGQVIHNATRRLVLQGVDGVAFIADSRVVEARSNAESFVNLKQNLRDAGIELKSLPLVIQFNKRDLPDTRKDDELRELARKGAEPVYQAIAVRGEGVGETFMGLVNRVLVRLENDKTLEKTFETTRQKLLATIADQLDLPLDPGSALLVHTGGAL